MADAATNDCQIIMAKVPEDKQPETALFLSGCFSLPPASTRGIAASGPIALLSDLSRHQAEAVMAELKPSLPQDVVLRIGTGKETSRVSRLQWPRPPRIYGRDLQEFAESSTAHDLKCPRCGGLIRVVQDGGGLCAYPSGSERRRGDTAARPAPSNEKDPLFSGVKPLATGTGNFASIRSLQAGDTGFWMDYSHSIFAPTEPPVMEHRAGDTSHAKKSTGKISAGLAAFMKPGAFALVVGRTREPQAVKMIAEIMGVTESEARDKCLSLGLCVAKDISLDEAQNLLARFRNLGARARIVKPK